MSTKFRCNELGLEEGLTRCPQALTSFTYDSNRVYTAGNSSNTVEHVAILRNKYEANAVNLNDYINNENLRLGYPDEGITGTLLALEKKITELQDSRFIFNKDLVTNRGILTKLALATPDSVVAQSDPYAASAHKDANTTADANADDAHVWTLNVMMVDKTLYIELDVTEESYLKDNDDTPQQRRMGYHGYAYETIRTQPWTERGNPHYVPPFSIDVNSQWCPLIQSGYNNCNWIVGGEVDCVRDRRDLTLECIQPRDYVELKCTGPRRKTFDMEMMQRKYERFFLQAFFLGTPTIQIGHRYAKSGQLLNEELYETHDLYRKMNWVHRNATQHDLLSISQRCDIITQIVASCKAHIGQDEETQQCNATLDKVSEQSTDEGESQYSMPPWPVFELALLPRNNPESPLQFKLTKRPRNDPRIQSGKDPALALTGFIPESYVKNLYKYKHAQGPCNVHEPKQVRPLDSVNVRYLFDSGKPFASTPVQDGEARLDLEGQMPVPPVGPSRGAPFRSARGVDMDKQPVSSGLQHSRFAQAIQKKARRT